MTSSRVVVIEPKREHYRAIKVTQFSKRCEGVLQSSPTLGTERVRLSAYSAQVVIEAIVQGKLSRNHSYSSSGESKQVAG